MHATDLVDLMLNQPEMCFMAEDICPDDYCNDRQYYFSLIGDTP